MIKDLLTHFEYDGLILEYFFQQQNIVNNIKHFNEKYLIKLNIYDIYSKLVFFNPNLHTFINTLLKNALEITDLAKT